MTHKITTQIGLVSTFHSLHAGVDLQCKVHENTGSLWQKNRPFILSSFNLITLNHNLLQGEENSFNHRYFMWHVGAILKDDGNSRWFETGLTLSKEYWIIDLTCFNKRTTRPSGLSVAVDAVCISCPFGNLVLELFVVIRHVPLQRSTDSSSSTPVYQSFNWIGRGNSQWWVLWWNLGILADMW